MKRILIILLISFVTITSYGQKKRDSQSADQNLPTIQQMDSAANAIYMSYDADRQMIQNQIQQAEDSTFRKALSYQWNALETKCANRIWGYVLSQPQCDATVQMMMRLRTTVDKEIVKKSISQIKDKKLLQSKAGEVLTYYVENEQAELGKKFIDIQVPALGTEGKALKLSDEIKDKSIMLIMAEHNSKDIPATFSAFYKQLDRSSIDVIQVGFYSNIEEAATAKSENKSDWPFYADSRGSFSPVILDYNVQETPYCIIIEKGTGNISYLGVGISDDLLGILLTH